jgi:hypothetical protein
MNIKTILKSSVAASALFAFAAPVSTTAMAADDTFSSGASTNLVMSGHVSRVIWHGDDGNSSRTFFTGPGGAGGIRVRWVASGTLSDSVTGGATAEINAPENNTGDGAQLYTTGPGDSGTLGAVTSDDTWALRHQYVWVNHKTMGKLSLGHTSTATDGYGAADGKKEGRGLKYVDTTATTPVASARTAGGAVSDLNVSRLNLIRYDTPTIGGFGLKIAKHDTGGWATGLAYAGNHGAVAVTIKAGYVGQAADDASKNFTALGSIALAHDSGLSFKFGAAKTNYAGAASKIDTASQQGGRDDPHVYSFDIGYSMPKLVSVGATSFAFQYHDSNNVARSKTDAVTLNLSATQSFDALGATMKLGYSKYTLEATQVTTAGTDVVKTFDDIDVIALQTTFNF